MWSEVVSWEPRAFVYHNFLTKEVRAPAAACGEPRAPPPDSLLLLSMWWIVAAQHG